MSDCDNQQIFYKLNLVSDHSDNEAVCLYFPSLSWFSGVSVEPGHWTMG
jgi:hypothetical protein